MIKNIKKIVVLGGGSAGWMSASTLIKTYPNIDISVIESPKIPTIGVGESTLGGIRYFCEYLGINEKDFMKDTDASYKLSIKFTDFYEKNGGSFHYPFGLPNVEGCDLGLIDWMWKKALEPNTPVADYVKSYFPAAALFDENKFSQNQHGQFDNYNPRLDAAYHFDAVKFGLWLRDKYCIPRGVVHISDTVTNITTNDNGIESLELESGTVVTADLFVDCTGFRSLLLGDTLQVPFKSYTDILPNDSAWACQIPYIDKSKEIEPFTNCTAIENGWCWNTPLWSRIGTGYVFSTKFTSSENALVEFKNYLMSDKMVIPRTQEQIDQLKFREVPFKVGIYQETFVKNVVAIGLSAAFIEPLESNGLYSVHEFLFKLMKTLQRGSITQWDRDAYNSAVRGMFQNFIEFVALHYALTIRNDTPYWSANADRKYNPGMEELAPTMSVGFTDLVGKKMFNPAPNEHDGITWISTGMNYMFLDQIQAKMINIKEGNNAKQYWAPYFLNLEKKKERWKKAAEKELTLYEFLKRNIYK
jgi:tryptophan halogenase